MRSGLFGAEGLHKATPRGFVRASEGTTAVLFPPSCQNGEGRYKECEEIEKDGDDGQAVFYNPAQVVNRDLSVCVIACFSKLRKEEPKGKGGTRRGITILEALSATGLRAIRYYKEVPDVRFIIANDIDAGAVECIERNCEFNEVPCVKPTVQENFPSSSICVDEATGSVESGGAIIANLDDANDLMSRLAANPTVSNSQRLCLVSTVNQCGSKALDIVSNEPNRVTPLLQQELMDVVDLDPYGSASPFLEGAMRCIREGGLLLVTSTDSAILCGNYPDTCHAKYNTVPLKSAACHEMAVRILLAALERVANKHRKYIVPLLCLHIDFYVRCFVRVYTQPAEVKLSPCKLGYLMQCSHCPAFWVSPMAVSRTRGKKRQRSVGNTAKGEGADEGHCTPNSPNVALDSNASSCRADVLGRERYPRAPSRHENPKVVCPNLLQTLPSSLRDRCCGVCGAPVALSGPIYASPMQSVPFLEQLLREIQRRGSENQITAVARITGLVRVAMEELPDTPLFYQLPDVASFVRVRCPPAPLFVGALGRMGYRCSQVHCAPSGIKTDCPPDVIVGVMMQWKTEEEKKKAVVEGVELKISTLETVPDGVVGSCDYGKVDSNSNQDTVKKREMNSRTPLVKPLSDADFSYEKQFDFRGAVTGVAKFIPNAPNWGPKRRHQGLMPTVENTS